MNTSFRQSINVLEYTNGISHDEMLANIVIESANQVFLNIFNLSANRKNIQSLEDYISNEVYRLCSDEEIKFRQPEIRMRR